MPSLSQELGKNKVLCTESLSRTLSVADRNGGLDDHRRNRIDGHDTPNDCFNRLSVEVIGPRAAICRRSDDDVVRTDVNFPFIECCAELEQLILLLRTIFDRQSF